MYKYIWYLNLIGAITWLLVFFITFNWTALAFFAMISLVLMLTYNHVWPEQVSFLNCVKCKKELVRGEYGGVTTGYYDCSEGFWADLIFPKTPFDVEPVKDRVVCDECMWNNENYIAKYGKVN